MSEIVVPTDEYPVSARSRAKRRHERAHYDHASVHAILDSAMVCHIAYVVDGQPYCTPTAFWREGGHLYWHGSSSSRMLRAQASGLPVCLTVTHLDGLVLGRSGFNHSVDYRSAMCFGIARIVDEPTTKVRALDAMIDRFYPGRTAELRATTTQEAKATMVIAMEIEEASAKIRSHGFSDEGEDCNLPVYVARFPVTQTLGAAQPCLRMPADVALPAGLVGFTDGRRFDEVMLESHRKTFRE
jgi:nitroimidazol reductase NimA-like FMN-containing flavoprotein (pyridoxamine 5'-phosphate oxidase superfamily)